jgi:hypothetical protein
MPSLLPENLLHSQLLNLMGAIDVNQNHVQWIMAACLGQLLPVLLLYYSITRPKSKSVRLEPFESRHQKPWRKLLWRLLATLDYVLDVFYGKGDN